VITPPGAPQRTRLLLVDDCITERDLYECVLRATFDVMTAARGAEGVELAIRTQPDAIVLDLSMPGMDGWETCRQLKGHLETASIPVVLLTGDDDPTLSERARRVGAVALLVKPCSVDRLNTAIQSYTRLSGREPASS
jgi:CheY-like chemotaxis protein